MSPSSAERSRAGVRAWVRAAGSGLRKAGPYGIVAFLTAPAVAPVAGAALGAPAEFSAALQQLGGMGSNYLADSLVSASDRMRGSAVTDEQWRDAVAAELLDRLESGDSSSRAALRDEMAEVLRAVGAVEVALRAADDRGRRDLVAAFELLGELAEDAARSLAAITRTLAEQNRAQRQQTDLITQTLVGVSVLRQELRARAAATSPPAEPGDPDAEPPYPGMAPFDALDAQHFHGRRTLVAELMGRLNDQVLGGPPLVVVGVSGVGKSSVLRAGVLPAILANGLADDSGTWPWLVMTPGAHPLATLAERSAALREAGLGDVPQVLLVDQFEEVFTQCADPAERAEFVRALAEPRPGVLIIAVRADFYPQCTELAPMVPLLGAGQVVIGPLTPDELRSAIEAPAEGAGLTVEPGLTDLLLADLGAPGYEPGALPLLAHALRITWDRRSGSTLTVAGYRDTGGIRKAVAASAEKVYQSEDEPGRAALRTALLDMVTLAGGLPVRHRVTRSEVDTSILGPLIAARLVTAGEDTVEISHEALLAGWPRLAGWLAEAREELLLRQRLTQAAADWAASGEDPDALYRGVRLDAAREWAEGRTLPPAQSRFLSASEAAALERESARERTTRRLRRLTAGLAVALLLVAAGGVAVWRQWNATDDARRLAESGQAAAETRTNFTADPVAAVHAALESWGVARTRESREAILYAQQATVFVPLGTSPGAHIVAVSPDGGRVATGFPDGRIQIWDTATQDQTVPEMRLPGGYPITLAFSPDGRYLATGGIPFDKNDETSKVIVWDATTGRLLHRLTAIGAIAWLPDSSALLAQRHGVTPFGPIGAFEPSSGRVLDSIAADVLPVMTAAVSRDGRHLALGGPAGGAVIRVADDRRLAVLDEGLTSLAFAADGTVFGTAPDGPVRSWSPADDWRRVTLNGPETYIGANTGWLTVTADGTVIVGGDEPRSLLALTRNGPRPSIPGFPSVAGSTALSADDRLLAVAAFTEPPMIARIHPGQLLHPQVVALVTYDATGARLATAVGNDPRIRVWDARSGKLTGTVDLTGGTTVLGLAYAPDGTLAATLEDGRVLLLDAERRIRGTLRMPSGYHSGTVAFSPDGTLLAAIANPIEPAGAEPEETVLEDHPDALVWDVATLELRDDLRIPERESRQLAFTPDGRFLLVAANGLAGRSVQDGSVWRYGVPDLAPVDHADLPGAPVGELAVSPDSRFVVLAHGLAAPVLRVDGLTRDRALGAQPVPIERVAWSPDGRAIATGSDQSDDVIRLWDAGSGALTAELRGQSNQWGRMVFSPDSSTLAVGTNDWALTRWQLDPAAVVPGLCDQLRRAYRYAGPSLPAAC